MSGLIELLNTMNSTDPSLDNDMENKLELRTLVLQCLLWTLFGVNIYILTTLLLREYFITKHRKINRLDRRSIVSARYSRALRAATIIGSVSYLLRSVCENVEIIFDNQDGDYCHILLRIKFILTFFFVTSIYTFLWIKQRMCYINPAMSHLTSKVTRFVSWASIVLIVSSGLVGANLFMWSRSYKK